MSSTAQPVTNPNVTTTTNILYSQKSPALSTPQYESLVKQGLVNISRDESLPSYMISSQGFVTEPIHSPHVENTIPPVNPTSTYPNQISYTSTYPNQTSYISTYPNQTSYTSTTPCTNYYQPVIPNTIYYPQYVQPVQPITTVTYQTPLTPLSNYNSQVQYSTISPYIPYASQIQQQYYTIYPQNVTYPTSVDYVKTTTTKY
jgi:hypothetical protein